MSMPSWIRRLFSVHPVRPIRKGWVGRRPRLESLEDRILPAVTATLLPGGILDIGLNADGDAATVSVAGSNLQILNLNAPSQVLAAEPLAAITGGVWVVGNNVRSVDRPAEVASLDIFPNSASDVGASGSPVKRLGDCLRPFLDS